jgi:hypothetical protein
MQIVSLKIPEPQTKTLGINKIAIATGLVRWGYNEAKVLNKAQIPVKEIKANITAVGR